MSDVLPAAGEPEVHDRPGPVEHPGLDPPPLVDGGLGKTVRSISNREV